MAMSRESRQQLIRQLVRQHAVKTQNELVAKLREHGYEVTQATVSRDIADLDLQKGSDGVYVLAEDKRLQLVAATAVHGTRRAGNQVIVLTEPGSASSVAAAIDAASSQGVLGSIAGDDTVLVIASDEQSGKQFQADMDALISK